MKNLITASIAVAIIATIFFFVGKSCSKQEEGIDHTRENELVTELRQLRAVNKSLTAEKDSLIEVTKRKIPSEIARREAQIDSVIAKDSSNSIVEYRKALVEDGWLPDGTDNLTFREIGIGAKGLAKIPKLELQIKGYDEIILKDNEIISNLNFQIKANEDLREMQRLAILDCEKQLEKEKAWYNSNYLWLGLGVAGATAVAIIIGSVK